MLHKFLKRMIPGFVRSFLRMIRRSLRNLTRKIRLYASFSKDYLAFKKLSGLNSRFLLLWKNRYPQLFDNTDETIFDPHYTYHPAWAARIIAQIKPKEHVDVSSILYFSTILSAFVPVRFYEYRPANIKLDNLHMGKADLLSLPFGENSIESLSCMHTIEHVGLGRYGDPIDPDGDIKAINELKRVLAKSGNLLFVVPMGQPTISFNAHRVYSYDQIMSYFKELELIEFSLIPDYGRQVGIIKNASREQANSQKFGCGLFWFSKK